MKNIIPSVKGTRDFYPEEMALRVRLYEKARQVSERFGYQEYEAPILETLDLYAAKSGEELVKEQAFVFTDRSGTQIALRPELTPSLARMIAQRQRQLTYPARWWSFGPFWRYERPQKGRTREFFQWNIDMLGVSSPEADAELVAVAASFLEEVGLSPKQARIFVNDRRLMDSQFDLLGIPQEQRLAVSNLVDRRSKMKAEVWEAYALDTGLSESQLQGLKALLENKSLWEKSEDLTRLFRALDALGAAEYVEFDPNVVRGLLYYTGTVFEAFDLTGGVRRAILGGGRYDNLLADVGGDPLSGVGFAMGDVVMGIVLKEKGLIPPFNPSPAPVLVTIFDEELWRESYALAAELRREGLNVLAYPEPAKLGKQFKFANKMGVRVAVVLGPDEFAAGKVAVKEMQRGEQVILPREEAAAHIHKILAAE
jgi:histidyl-tRNA synthetase